MNENLYDVVIIGGGPAGLAAALYLARARYRVVVVEKEHFGGQITITAEVVNYPGAQRVSGTELTETMLKQAQSFGAEFLLTEVDRLELDGDIKKVHTSRGVLNCFGVLLATGAHPRMIGFKGEEEFKGHGVAYCATCDGEFFTDMDVFVVGGGFAAAEESVFLTKYARHITILVRGEDFSCAKSVADTAKNNEKITVLTNVQVEEVTGDTALRSLKYKNRKTGEITVYEPPKGESFGVFIFAGYEPATDLVKGVADLNEQGYILTDKTLQTSVEGLYAAGDVCVKSLRQVVTATGDGALAATELERYAASMQKKTGLRPQPPAPAKQPEKKEEAKTSGQNNGSLFSDDMLAQLHTVFGRMEKSLRLNLYLDDRDVSRELKEYMNALAKETDKLTVEEHAAEETDEAPCVKVCREDGTWTGLAFHGVPGGHEFTSFILGLYNAAGPGQAVEPEIKERIQKIDKKTDLRIMVSLSCTMCPELVTAAQKIAAENENVTAQIYDLNHYPAMKEQYNVMSVPCMVMNDKEVTFGKKNVQQLLDFIG